MQTRHLRAWNVGSTAKGVSIDCTHRGDDVVQEAHGGLGQVLVQQLGLGDDQLQECPRAVVRAVHAQALWYRHEGLSHTNGAQHKRWIERHVRRAAEINIQYSLVQLLMTKPSVPVMIVTHSRNLVPH